MWKFIVNTYLKVYYAGIYSIIQDWFNIEKSKNHMIISIVTEKAIDKPTPIHDKTSQQGRERGELLKFETQD